MSKLKSKSIFISYLFGLPFGGLSIAATIFLPGLISGEGLFTMAMLAVYGKAAIGLTVGFLVALWIGGVLVYKSVVKGIPVLWTALRYSLTTNSIIWMIFCVIVLLTVKEEPFLFLIPAAIAFTFCVVGTTFTLGFLISYIVQQMHKNAFPKQ
ncbi:hypothetical protein POV27_06490 [Aureisphaera galaxeae]|uniref:hypothetical protein n=1 Tax=Aureisphaera galaxeae TaxID=1538023 RepID=UPI00234FB9AD|nr:hypothetical protein [Aureisphaera galaxeae]MDC8003691.1 hypothetical protein [Aureisphaera galaxeae]